MKIAILGGTGDEGAGLSVRWATAGHEIIIGSRVTEKGERAAAAIRSRLPDETKSSVSGTDNLTAAQQGEIVVLSVPYAGQAPTLDAVKEALAGKLLICVVVPLKPPKVSHVWRPPAGSAAQEAQTQLGDSVRVVAAFENVSAVHMGDKDHKVECDVLVCGDIKEDKELVIELARLAGLRGIDAGPLQNASVVEGLTAVLIGINIRHKIKHAGIRITGLPEER